MRLRRGLKEAVQIGLLSGQLGAPGDAANPAGGERAVERKYITARSCLCTPPCK